MANALDYIAWRGDLSFEVAPINEVDIFLFTQIVMADFKGIVGKTGPGIPLGDVARAYFGEEEKDVRHLGVLQSENALPAFRAMGKAKRFKGIMADCHVNYVCDANDEQFSATAFRLSPELGLIAYRGTDDSIIGWKEDCHMAIYEEVPAQRDALRYLEKYAAEHQGKLIVAGHSKGGNLAVYAASNVSKDIRDRIVQVFNYDGPGFSKNFVEKNKGYDDIKDRITSIVSQNSIVGLLLETPGKITYIKSNVEGFYAHDGFTWEVERNHFLRVRGLSKFSRTFNEVFDSTMNKMSFDEKKRFVNELFDILFESGADTLTEFKNLGWRASLGTVTSLTGSKAIRDFFNNFLVSAVSRSNENKRLTSKNGKNKRTEK